MRLHLGRLSIFILLWPFSVFFPDCGDNGFFYANPLGRVPGVNIYTGFQSVILFLRNVPRPLSASTRASIRLRMKRCTEPEVGPQQVKQTFAEFTGEPWVPVRYNYFR